MSRLIFSTNHRDIGFVYFVTGFKGLLVGTSFSFIIRTELSYGGEHFINIGYHYYNVVVTAHAIFKIFFGVKPFLIGGFGNYLIPLYLGSCDKSFPRLNNLSLWLVNFAFLLILMSALLDSGAGTGWTVYPPLSSYDYHSGVSVDLAIFSLHKSGLSSLLGSINFIVTIIYENSFIYKLGYWPMKIWAFFVTSFLLLLAVPVLASGITMLLKDRNFNSNFFDCSAGGDPILFEHLFWFFGHPEVYILIVPVFGLISQFIVSSSRRGVYGSIGKIYAMWSIGLLGFIVWAHHKFTVGKDTDSRAYFTAATKVIAVPTGIKIFSWLASIYESNIGFSIGACYLFAFLLLFIIGGLSGIVLSNGGLNISLHDTYYVTAHFHYVLSKGVLFGKLVSFYHYYTVIFSNLYGETFHLLTFIVLFIGVNLTFFPQHGLGLSGKPRRIPDYPDCYFILNYVSSLGSFLSIVGLGKFYVYNVIDLS